MFYMFVDLPSNLWYKRTKTQILNVSRLVLQLFLPQSIEAMC